MKKILTILAAVYCLSGFNNCASTKPVICDTHLGNKTISMQEIDNKLTKGNLTKGQFMRFSNGCLNDANIIGADGDTLVCTSSPSKDKLSYNFQSDKQQIEYELFNTNKKELLILARTKKPHYLKTEFIHQKGRYESCIRYDSLDGCFTEITFNKLNEKINIVDSSYYCPLKCDKKKGERSLDARRIIYFNNSKKTDYIIRDTLRCDTDIEELTDYSFGKDPSISRNSFATKYYCGPLEYLITEKFNAKKVNN